MKIATNVLEVLDQAETDGPRLVLTGQLDRKLYADTNKVLEAAGGKWNRSAKAHLFDGDAADVMEQIILTGEVVSAKQEFGYFPTPAAVVEQLIELADLRAGMTVLEPSAGRGAIAGPIAALGCHVDCIELQRDNALAISDAGIGRDLAVADFLTVEPSPFCDRVVMNPPFAKQADIRHVTHAYQFLKPGGLLVAVMSNGMTFRNTTLTREFRALISSTGGQVVPLPEGAFKESGTGVNTVIAVLPKPA
ncbi:methyltransferase [Streptomyces sp. NPDC008061]|uniref:methyltransferase n=1 Tax=Streptomyces sp. NPDC008061 TaxID=3364805 RepID=UPI0036E386A3